jgi:Zn-dependent protease with chaperone function
MKHKSLGPRKDHGTTAPHEFMGIPVLVDIGGHFIAESRGIWPWKKIVLGFSWFVLTPREKEAVLLHEAAHCKMFHMERRICAVPMLFIRPAFATQVAMGHELAADRFAASQGFGKELLSVLAKMRRNQSADSGSGQFYPTYVSRETNLRKFIKGNLGK